MAYYKDLNSLLRAIQNDVREAMVTDVFDDVVEIQREEIIAEVYDAYEPYQYNRRGDNGGLSDPDNNIATFTTVTDGVQMLIQNITRGQDNGQYITPLIEGGQGTNGMYYDYPYNRSNTAEQFLQPRSFISSTVYRLSRTLEHVDSLKRGLKKRGYEFYK